MRRLGILLVLVGTLLFAAPFISPSAAQRPARFDDPEVERHGWLSNLEEGRRRATESGKPLMVVFRCVP
jgi:hypothetical protein